MGDNDPFNNSLEWFNEKCIVVTGRGNIFTMISIIELVMTRSSADYDFKESARLIGKDLFIALEKDGLDLKEDAAEYYKRVFGVYDTRKKPHKATKKQKAGKVVRLLKAQR